MFNQEKIGIFITVGFGLILSFLLGIMCERMLLTKEVRVSYISQSELLDLERIRLSGENGDNKQLFLGHPEEAIKFIEKAKFQKEGKANIVLIAEKKIYGKSIKSISKEVHRDLISYLEKK